MHPQLELNLLGLPMAERLALAAARLEGQRGPAEPEPSLYLLRREQRAVFDDFSQYLLEVARRPARTRAAFCRIILPPRTGKTIIAGHIIARSGLTAAVLVPTRTLVEQTARVLRELLPGVPVGVFSGERRDEVEHGVNVTTYALLQRVGVAGLPEPIRRAALVFADEAHHAMTESRLRLLRNGFEPGALRVALTATPDYDADRRLAVCFPDLIHEIDLCEALELELLAPLRVWVAEVDADASRVHMVRGDYEQAVIGRLMSSAPFFRAAELFRYGSPERELPALVSCATRQQAYDLHKYLRKHRPPGRPRPALLLGETPGAERTQVLARFERGEIDTLIQVGVLIEGWSSPRCKLLVDLAPTASRVRATQKYFRVMTRQGDTEARIYVLVPRGLPSAPVLPMDLFGAAGQEYVCGARLGRRGPDRQPSALSTGERTLIAGVELKQRLVVDARMVRPRLDRHDTRQIRRVLASCPDFEPGCGLFQFRGLFFEHPLFTGRGDFLLAWLGVASRRAGFDAFLGRLYPQAVAARLLDDQDEVTQERWCEEDVAYLEAALACKGRSSPELVAVWSALGGRVGPLPTPEEGLLTLEEKARLRALVTRLAPRQRELIVGRFGLEGDHTLTFAQLGRQRQVGGARARQIIQKSLWQLRRWTRGVEEDGGVNGFTAFVQF